MNACFNYIKKNAFLVCTYIFLMMIIILAIVAAAHIGYSLAEMQCAIEHEGASAPQSIVLFLLIPYGFVELILLAALIITNKLHKKYSKTES